MSTEDSVGLQAVAVWVCWNEPLSRRVHMTIRKKNIQQERLIISCKDISDGGKEEAREWRNGFWKIVFPINFFNLIKIWPLKHLTKKKKSSIILLNYNLWKHFPINLLFRFVKIIRDICPGLAITSLSSYVWFLIFPGSLSSKTFSPGHFSSDMVCAFAIHLFHGLGLFWNQREHQIQRARKKTNKNGKMCCCHSC